MSWRFRQSFKIIPGLRLNLSKSGLSASVGSAPFSINIGPKGVYGTASLPGTGISFRQRLSVNLNERPKSSFLGPTPLSPKERPRLPQPSPPNAGSYLPPVEEIRSASTELLTSDSLKELKNLLRTAYDEHEAIKCELTKAKQENIRATKRFQSWDNGFLFKKLFKQAFSVRSVEAEIAAAKERELDEQLQLTTISTQVELAKEQAEPFFKMRDDFTALSECAAIWDIQAQRATNQFRERTLADHSVSRENVRFNLDYCDLIKWEEKIPHLQNAKGGEIFLYPGFILYRASKTAFSVIDFHDVRLTSSQLKFQEQNGVPNDSQTIGQTWAKTNKDGSRDRRFAANYQIPIAVYGELTLKSETGLWEEFHFSNPEPLLRFVKSFNAFVASFEKRISLFVVNESPPSPTNDSCEQALPKLVGADIHFECQMCGQPIEVNIEANGQEFRCPGCGQKLVVPTVSP